MADVSVVIPTRNRAELVTRAIDSALAQRPAPAEVIVVDDASSDDTAQRLSRWGDRVRIVTLPHRRERGHARNVGAALAVGHGLAFLDADDMWLPGKLAAQLPILKEGRPSVTGVIFVDGEGDPFGQPYVPPTPLPLELMHTNPVIGGASSLLLPRDLFLSLGGYPTQWAMQGSEDWLMMYKLTQTGAGTAVIPGPFVAYRVHPGNSQADAAAVARSQSAAAHWIVREGGISRDDAAQVYGHTSARIAQLYANQGDLRESGAWLARTVRRGSSGEIRRALVLIPASAARGALRRTAARVSRP